MIVRFKAFVLAKMRKEHTSVSLNPNPRKSTDFLKNTLYARVVSDMSCILQ